MKQPTPALHNPQQALQAMAGFSRAKIVSQLSDGPTNASYRVERGSEQYVMRLDKPDVTGLGLDRTNERRVNEVAAAAGLAPQPLHFDPAAGISLRRFISGQSWARSDLLAPGNLQRLAGVLQKLHGLPPVGNVFEPAVAARRYATQIGTAAAAAIAGKAEEIASKIRSYTAAGCLCHNDLVCQNVLEGERLILIDWEYAGIGDPYFDLAVVVRHHNLDRTSANILLDAWLGQAARARETTHLSLQCEFYGCLLQLWEQLPATGNTKNLRNPQPPGGC
jgi:thiamine kinase-like enzyme